MYPSSRNNGRFLLQVFLLKRHWPSKSNYNTVTPPHTGVSENTRPTTTPEKGPAFCCLWMLLPHCACLYARTCDGQRRPWYPHCNTVGRESMKKYTLALKNCFKGEKNLFFSFLNVGKKRHIKAYTWQSTEIK